MPCWTMGGSRGPWRGAGSRMPHACNSDIVFNRDSSLHIHPRSSQVIDYDCSKWNVSPEACHLPVSKDSCFHFRRNDSSIPLVCRYEDEHHAPLHK